MCRWAAVSIRALALFATDVRKPIWRKRVSWLDPLCLRAASAENRRTATFLVVPGQRPMPLQAKPFIGPAARYPILAQFSRGAGKSSVPSRQVLWVFSTAHESHGACASIGTVKTNSTPSKCVSGMSGDPGLSAAIAALCFSSSLLAVPFVHGLGGIEQQGLIGIRDRPDMFRRGRKNFKIPALPRQDLAKASSPPKCAVLASIISPLCTQILPSSAPCVTCSTEELRDRHSSWIKSTRLLLCMPRKPLVRFRFAIKEALDAILKKFDFLAVGWFLPERFHPLGISARAIFLVHHACQYNDSQIGNYGGGQWPGPAGRPFSACANR